MAEGCVAGACYWPGLYAEQSASFEPIGATGEKKNGGENRSSAGAGVDGAVDAGSAVGGGSGGAALSGFLFVLLAVVVFCVITFRYHVRRPLFAVGYGCVWVLVIILWVRALTDTRDTDTHTHMPYQLALRRMNEPWESGRTHKNKSKRDDVEDVVGFPVLGFINSNLNQHTHNHTHSDRINDSHTLASKEQQQQQQKIYKNNRNNCMHRNENKINCAE